MSDEEVFDWDRFGDNRIKFDVPGVEAIGNIVKLKIATIMQPSGDEADMPELTLQCDDGKIRTVLASQVGLQSLLSQHKPKVGDRIKITFTSATPLGGGRTAKNFEVRVIPGGGGATTPPVEEAPVAAAAANGEEPF